MRNLQFFYDDSIFGILSADEQGRATYTNPAWTQISGLTAHDSMGNGWLDAVHLSDRARVLGEWREAVATGRVLDAPARIVRPDGSRRYVRLRGRALAPAVGRQDSYVGVILDMTDTVLAERRLRRNNQLLSAVLENIPCAVTVFDGDGRLVLDNQKYRASLSLPDGAPEGVVTDFGTVAVDAAATRLEFPETDHPAVNTEPDEGPRVREETQPDGRILEVRDARMPGGGLVTTYSDITQHKQIIETLQQAKAAAEQAAAAKAAFLATMSHEIRTPMNGVIGMTNMLLETGLTRDQRDLVDVIRQSGESLLVIINDILDYSKIESGQMELEWTPLRVRDVIDNSVQLVKGKAQEKGVAVSISVSHDVPPLVHGDRNRLQQIVVNLLSNAVKFTEAGEIRVSVDSADGGSRSTEGLPTGDMCSLLITVADTGIGIAADKLAAIFEPFVQADSSTARRFGGTGLGLAIARRLVEAMGGEIRIESRVGRGTTASFSFLAEVAAPAPRAGPDREGVLSGKKVLLVSGSRSDVGVLLTQLKRWGMQCFTSPASSDAVRTLSSQHEMDLVVIAAHMVDTRGLEFVRELRSAGVTRPVVLLSRKKTAERADADLAAWLVPRSASECSLYESLINALQFDPAKRPRPVSSQFDPLLAQRAPLRILIAEDNEINRRVALKVLAGFGYVADVASNGQQVIDMVQALGYDLVLMDIQMPIVDGLEATRFIATELPAGKRPRVVAMSANVMREHVEDALAAGAADYISKPFSPTELRAALEDAAKQLPRSELPKEREQADTVLCLERVESHLEVDRSGEFLGGLAKSFSDTSAKLLSRLDASLRVHDPAEIRAVLHEYAGMAGVLGAEKLLNLVSELQQVAGAGRLPHSSVHAIAQAEREAVAALNEYVNQHGVKQPPDAAPGKPGGRSPHLPKHRH